jgi:hypothetical protein
LPSHPIAPPSIGQCIAWGYGSGRKDTATVFLFSHTQIEKKPS